MSYDIYNKMDIRNRLKQCPYCLRYWYRSELCDGNVTCGDIPT